MLTLVIILVPLVLSLAVFGARTEKNVRMLALAGSLVEFGVVVAAFIQFKTSCHCNLLFNAEWFSMTMFSLRLGLDGISLLLVAMTAFLVPLIILSTFSHHYENPQAFYSLIFLMEMALTGVFSAYDGLIFYIFWELALIPAWFICALWGGTDRIRITFKFFVYTFTGSLFMLLALIWLFLKTPEPHSFSFGALTRAMLSPAEQSWIFAAFFLAFAIKIPVFPFHTWQPDTYTESPPAGSMLLAGIMLKMGIFGMIRWMLPLTPLAMQQWAPVVLILAVTGIVYASVIAIRQSDLKRLVAYSSIAHVGLIAAGVFAFSQQAMQGAIIQMVSHGINVVGLFIILDIIERRTGTRVVGELGGLANRVPLLAAFFMIILLGSIALPLTNGFVGEFLLLIGIFGTHPVMAAIAGLTIIFGAVYMLWMYQRTMLGPEQVSYSEIRDLTPAELAALIPIVVMIFWIGIFPSFFLDTALPDVIRLLQYLR